jgi:hypothetical protein
VDHERHNDSDSNDDDAGCDIETAYAASEFHGGLFERSSPVNRRPAVWAATAKLLLQVAVTARFRTVTPQTER